MNTQSEFDFLKDQVERLNGVLSNYQDMFVQNLEKSGSNKLRLILNNHTAPLLAEYDRIIHVLRIQLEASEKFTKEEQIRVNSIFKENERLHKQMNSRADHVQTRMAVNISDNIQQQVDLLTKEKKSLEELMHMSEMEIHRLQSIINEYDMKPQTMIFNEKMEEIKQRYQGSTSELEREIAGLRETKRELTNELGKQRKQFSEMEKDYLVSVEQLRFEKEAGEENSNLLKSSLKRMELMDKEKKQLLAHLDELKSTIRCQDTTKSEWNTALESLESRYHEKEQQIYEASLKIKEAYQMAEDANTEKKAAEIRELQAANECDRLRGVISGILDDAGARTREEVDLVMEKGEKEVERILEELNLCEQNRQELLAEIEQVKRNKTQLEQEMEFYHRAERERNLQELSSAEVSHERMMRAERERETLRLQYDTLLNNLEKEKTDKERSKESFESEISALQNKLAQLQMSCDRAQSNADRFAKLLNTSEESGNLTRKKYQESLKKARHDFEILKQSSQIRQQELETRLTSTEDTQRHTTTEMRHILQKQQQLSSKWKEEAHSLSNQYEERLNQLTKELERQKVRNTELVSILQQSKQQILESYELIDEKKKTIEILDDRLRILDGDDHGQIDLGNVDGSKHKDDNNWQLKQIKKQQQKSIRETVARKYFIS